jgi:hypothetical protein
MASALGWPCETVIASIREPSDFAGLPVVVGESVRFAPPTWALRVVLERVGDLELPPEVAVVAAANPPEQAADGWDLSAPLANRLCHLAWEVDPAAVADGLAGGWAAPVVPVLPECWLAETGLAWPWWPRSCASARHWPAPRRPTRPRPGAAGRNGLARPRGGAGRPSSFVLTDGFTPWPDEPPLGVRVVVGLLGDAAPDAPGWARTVRVPSAP